MKMRRRRRRRGWPLKMLETIHCTQVTKASLLASS
jgi:hypothetical protein